MDQEKEQGFKVQDKRSSFQESSETAQTDTTSTDAQSTAEPEQTREAKQEEQRQAQDDTSSIPLPEANFMTLVISFAFPTQIALGLIPDPMTQQMMKELTQAKYHIDLLSVLREKTKGNLTKEEDQAFEQILFDLRMAYVDASK